MTIAEKNFWLTTVEAPQIPVRDLPQSVDVAVIGAGFTGLSAARTLAKGGARVAVLEAENVGWGASCRNGGMVLSGLKLGTTKLVAMYGREATKRMYAASLESIDCVEAVVREENIECNFSRCGHLEVACKAKHFEDFRRGAETIEREFGHTLRIVEKADLASEIGSPIYHGGMGGDGRAAFFPENENTVRESARILREGMIDVYPQLREAKVEYVWGGTLDFAFDIMPHAGKMEGMYFSVGYAGHGVAMATLLGQKIAMAILTGRDENPFAGIPFPGGPWGRDNGKPGFLPVAGAWSKVLDWVS